MATKLSPYDAHAHTTGTVNIGSLEHAGYGEVIPQGPNTFAGAISEPRKYPKLHVGGSTLCVSSNRYH